MKKNTRKFYLLLFSLLFILVTFSAAKSFAADPAPSAPTTPAERCAALKQSLQINANDVRQGSDLAGQNLAGTLPYYCTSGDLIVNVINILMTIAGSVAVLFLIVGGFWYLTAAGNEETAEKGRKTLINSIIGLVVVIMSYAIVRVVVSLLNSGTGSGAGK